MLDDSVRPSREAEPALRTAGWSPGRAVDISAWVDALGAERTELFPLAETILRSFGGLALRGEDAHGARETFDVNPAHWIGMRECDR